MDGLSGSLILLLLGFYRPLIDHCTSWAKEILLSGDWSHFGQLIGMIGCFGIGCIIGIVLISKVMAKLLEKFHTKLLSEEYLYHSHILLYIIHQEMINHHYHFDG